MEFRSPTVAMEQNAKAIAYLTKNLRDPEMGRKQVELLIAELGNWHHLLTAPPRKGAEHISSVSQLKAYEGIDHTVDSYAGSSLALTPRMSRAGW